MEKDFERVKKFRHLILFAKGHYDISNSEYWPTLKKICDNYLGHSVSNIVGLYEMSNKARIAVYGDEITVEKFNSTMLELFDRNVIIGIESETKMSPIRYMIRTNLALLCDATNDKTGGLNILGEADLDLSEPNEVENV